MGMREILSKKSAGLTISGLTVYLIAPGQTGASKGPRVSPRNPDGGSLAMNLHR
jgi:hypothetical protein